MSAPALYTNIKLFEARREINIDKRRNSRWKGLDPVKDIPGEPRRNLRPELSSPGTSLLTEAFSAFG